MVFLMFFSFNRGLISKNFSNLRQLMVNLKKKLNRLKQMESKSMGFMKQADKKQKQTKTKKGFELQGFSQRETLSLENAQ